MLAITLIPVPYSLSMIPAAQWFLKCEAKRILTDGDLLGRLELLEKHFPQPGAPSHQPQPVILFPGRDIGEHAHSEWTMLYYPAPGDNPAALLVNGVRIIPGAHTAVLMQPGTMHSVEKQTAQDEPRLSIALRWETL